MLQVCGENLPCSALLWSCARLYGAAAPCCSSECLQTFLCLRAPARTRGKTTSTGRNQHVLSSVRRAALPSVSLGVFS